MMASGWADPAVIAGTRSMLDSRARVLEEGGRTIGWKLAFGAPHWLERLGLPGPVVGFLPESNVRAPGTAVPCLGWTNPVAEPEIAIYFGRDVEAPDRVVESISGMGAAIELADVDFPPEEIEAAIAGNIFHRGVVLGEPDPTLVDGRVMGMRALITKNESVIADTEDLEALTGGLISILAHAAGLLETAGERIRAGDVVIAGSVVPPIPVRPGDEVTFELMPLAPISVTV